MFQKSAEISPGVRDLADPAASDRVFWSKRIDGFRFYIPSRPLKPIRVCPLLNIDWYPIMVDANLKASKQGRGARSLSSVLSVLDKLGHRQLTARWSPQFFPLSLPSLQDAWLLPGGPARVCGKKRPLRSSPDIFPHILSEPPRPIDSNHSYCSIRGCTR